MATDDYGEANLSVRVPLHKIATYLGSVVALLLAGVIGFNSGKSPNSSVNGLDVYTRLQGLHERNLELTDEVDELKSYIELNLQQIRSSDSRCEERTDEIFAWKKWHDEWAPRRAEETKALIAEIKATQKSHYLLIQDCMRRTQ